MVSRRRAAARLDDFFIDDDLGSESDVETYDESLDVASIAGTLFRADSDDDASDDDVSGPPTARSGPEPPRDIVISTPKPRRSKRDWTVARAQAERPRPIKACTPPRRLRAHSQASQHIQGQ